MTHLLKTAIGVLLLSLLLTIARGSYPPPNLTTAQAIDFMKSADSAWIFTVDAIESRGPGRELDKVARRQIVELIADPDNFGKPINMPIDRPAVGIEFERRGRKFTLYTTWEFGYFYDTFPASEFFAVLSPRRHQLAQTWQEKYFPRRATSLQPASGN